MLLVSGAAVILPACDGQITVSGSVVDEKEAPIVDACIYLGDRRYSDILERYEADPETHIGCTHRSNEEGHFVATGTIAGRGNHDFWVIVWKEGYQDYYGRVWHGDGVPSSTVEVTVVLEALAPE